MNLAITDAAFCDVTLPDSAATAVWLLRDQPDLVQFIQVERIRSVAIRKRLQTLAPLCGEIFSRSKDRRSDRAAGH
jgi:hypothetical protein